MAFSIGDMSFQNIALIVIVIAMVLVVGRILFKKYFSALIFDFVISPFLSFVDEFFGGVLGLDWGNWLSAFIGYRGESKISGKAVALFVAWEAAAFLPISLIPVVGTGVEYVTNWLPTRTICRFLFNKFRPAEKKEKKLEEEISIAEQVGLDVRKQKKVLKDIKKLIKKSDPVGALKEFRSEKPIKKVSSKLRDYVDSLISDANKVIQYIVKQNIDEATQDMVNELQQGINKAGDLLQQAQNAENSPNEDFNAAINLSKQAKDVIYFAANRFDNEFQQYQSQPQQNR